MSKQEQALRIIATTREMLTEAYGEKFTGLDDSERTNIMICVLHDLASRNKEIMDVFAAEFAQAVAL